MGVTFAFLLMAWCAPHGAFSRRTAANSTCLAEDGVGKFQCPDACQECCTAPWIAGMGTLSKRFKCVLKTAEDVPAGCDEPVKRSKAWSQKKTICDFSKEDVRAKTHKVLEATPCSTRTRCCCDESDNWSEKVCLPMNATGQKVTALSQKSKKLESYEALSDSYANTDQDCKGEDSVAVPHQRTMNGPMTTKGCCLEAKMVSETYTYRACTRQVPTMIGSMMAMRSESQPCHKTGEVMKCMRFEKLFNCGGVTQTGRLFQRVSTKTGLCIGDKSTVESLTRVYGPGPGYAPITKVSNRLKCPAGYSPWDGNRNSCKCPFLCG